MAPKRTLAVHGGAGAWSEELRPLAMEGIERALDAGLGAFGGGPLDACVAAVRFLEDDPIFNAGIGAALNADGYVELDAGVMEGRDLRAGAIAAVRDIRHPVDLARAVMEDGRHVLLVADGASRFAELAGIEKADPKLFIVERRRRQHEQWQRGEGDTVGAVAFEDGHLAAAVSTGGYTGKLPGRVGDSPILGAGLYVDDERGAAVCTGSGEGFMRLVIAKFAVDAMESASGAEAGAKALELLARRVDGKGGLITIDRQGFAAGGYNTDWMPWASRRNWD
ncbi:MAG TPA: isoaspartyl peptidase/L-asparaginase [Candidatus Dormibacteraeota bacterium]|jgi:beta-aspartyl-peptidase (threonine type)